MSSRTFLHKFRGEFFSPLVRPFAVRAYSSYTHVRRRVRNRVRYAIRFPRAPRDHSRYSRTSSVFTYLCCTENIHSWCTRGVLKLYIHLHIKSPIDFGKTIIKKHFGRSVSNVRFDRNIGFVEFVIVANMAPTSVPAGFDEKTKKKEKKTIANRRRFQFTASYIPTT